MQRKFITYLLYFFVPVVIGYAVVEHLTLQLNTSYSHLSKYMAREANNIEVLVLGSSQMKGGINPEYLEQKTLNLAAGNQHHDTDFKLLQQLVSGFPALETVVLEVSYSHFELPHNGPHFWKNNIYLKYYGVNAFERTTYFKDRLIYISNPPYYSQRILDQIDQDARRYGFNEYGYDTLNYYGLFKDLRYDATKISKEHTFKINKTPNLAIFDTNTQLFFEMLAYLERNNFRVILCEPPMYKTYLSQRHPAILERRDSIVALAQRRYKNVQLFSLEHDTIHFTAKDFWNQSHLNPTGAKIFSERLNEYLLEQNY